MKLEELIAQRQALRELGRNQYEQGLALDRQIEEHENNDATIWFRAIWDQAIVRDIRAEWIAMSPDGKNRHYNYGPGLYIQSKIAFPKTVLNTKAHLWIKVPAGKFCISLIEIKTNTTHPYVYQITCSRNGKDVAEYFKSLGQYTVYTVHESHYELVQFLARLRE